MPNSQKHKTSPELPALSSDSTANLMEGDRARFWRGRRRSMSRSGIESSTRVAQVPNSHFLEDRCTSLLVLMGEMSGPWRLGNAATCCRHPYEAPAGTDALFSADDLQEACHRTACNQGRRLVISHALSSPFFRCFKPGTHCPNVSFCIRDRFSCHLSSSSSARATACTDWRSSSAFNCNCYHLQLALL